MTSERAGGPSEVTTTHVPYWARCEAQISWPDDNVSDCGAMANRRVLDPKGRERWVCGSHGKELEVLTVCEPCGYLHDTNAATATTGTDFTPTCDFHADHSWSERASVITCPSCVKRHGRRYLCDEREHILALAEGRVAPSVRHTHVADNGVRPTHSHARGDVAHGHHGWRYGEVVADA